MLSRDECRRRCHEHIRRAGCVSSIVIRGVSSISSSNQPLIIVDGLPMDNRTVNTGVLASDKSSTTAFSNRASTSRTARRPQLGRHRRRDRAEGTGSGGLVRHRCGERRDHHQTKRGRAGGA